jgi:hypothetical protein
MCLGNRLEGIRQPGCTFIAGVFPAYHGSFDGQSLYAESAFNCMIPEHWLPNDIFPAPVDGPEHWQWTIDLTVKGSWWNIRHEADHD